MVKLRTEESYGVSLVNSENLQIYRMGEPTSNYDYLKGFGIIWLFSFVFFFWLIILVGFIIPISTFNSLVFASCISVLTVIFFIGFIKLSSSG